MDTRLRILGICAALAVSAVVFLLPSDTAPPLPNPASYLETRVEALASNLKQPRAMAVTPEGAIFVAEKSGRIRIIEQDRLLEKPLLTFSAAAVPDGGLLGMAAHPDFTDGGFLYAFHTYELDGDLWNKISRIAVEGGALAGVETVLDRIPGSRFVNGGILKFGPDGMLYAGTGSVSDSLRLAQDPDSLAGKILRIMPSGAIPKDNPDPDSYVYAAGFRNPRGMTWDSGGVMYVSDAGSAKNDEINAVYAGGNYGWPDRQCPGNGRGGAHFCFDPALGIAGIAAEGDGLLIASLRATNLYLANTSSPGENPKALIGGLGRIRDVAHDGEGNLYVLTSNTDGMGFPDSADDRLVRIGR